MSVMSLLYRFAENPFAVTEIHQVAYHLTHTPSPLMTEDGPGD